MENVSMTLPASLLARHVNPVFIETGTFDGRTVQMALNLGFEHVISIETDKNLFDMAMSRFQGDDRVTLYNGDSLVVLPIVLQDLRTIATFWLDAHIQENFEHGSNRVPLLQELAIIARHTIKTHTIMIDDVRLMGDTGAGSPWMHTRLDSVLENVRAINPGYSITFADSHAAKEDILIATFTKWSWR